MKRLLLSILCSGFLFTGFAQKLAVTETGQEVILFQDGTWEYKDGVDASEALIPVNPQMFSKGKKATFLLKSTRVNTGFWLDPKLWSFQKAINNEDAEYEFQLKEGDLYGMIISEKMEIPLETLRDVALENARAVAPDLKIVREEYRTVNQLRVLMLQMNGTMQGIRFSYLGYYFSNSEGTVQFVTYTSQNLMDSYRSTCEDLLNGLVELDI